MPLCSRGGFFCTFPRYGSGPVSTGEPLLIAGGLFFARFCTEIVLFGRFSARNRHFLALNRAGNGLFGDWSVGNRGCGRLPTRTRGYLFFVRFVQNKYTFAHAHARLSRDHVARDVLDECAGVHQLLLHRRHCHVALLSGKPVRLPHLLRGVGVPLRPREIL